MTEASRGSPRRSSDIIFALAIIAAVLAIAIGVSGGLSLRLFGMRLSSRGTLRPAIVAILCLTIAYRYKPAWEKRSVGRWLARTGSALAPWVAVAAAATVVATWISYGTRAAGGSDTYGYVSQAHLWLGGDLHVRQDFAATVPWPDADRTFTPLGYRAAPDHTIVPTYAPGMPILMAIFMKAIGECGAFFVTPFCAAGLVLLTFVLGVQVSGRGTGALAALLTASSPTILLMTLWPMSDVPAATFWLMSLVIALRPSSPAAAALSGISAGIATLIRPNLAPLVLFSAGLVTWRPPSHASLRMRRLIAFALACAPLVAVVAWVNHDLYGSFLTSGYGDTSSIFRWQNLRPNLQRYPRWLWETQGAYIAVFLLAVALPHGPKPETRTLRWILLAYIAAVFGCYVFYIPFDDWWYLRFVIPAMPPMFVLSIDAVCHAGRRFGPAVPAIAAIAFTALSVSHAIGIAQRYAVFEIGEGEQKYLDVGRYLASELPPETVVISGLHAGSIRLYSHLRTLRVDLLDARWLDRAIAHLKSVGPSPYLVLEESEVRNFRQRYANQQSVAIVDMPAVAAHSRGVYVFSSDLNRSADPTRTIPRTTGCE